MINEFRKQAEFLRSMWDTEWADENEKQYDDLDKAVNRAYDNGQINGKDFNELVLTAFYDYMDDLKKFNAYAAGGKGTKILTTDSFKEAVTAAYEGFGWVTDEDGNEIDIYDEDGNALYPECIKEDER